MTFKPVRKEYSMAERVFNRCGEDGFDVEGRVAKGMVDVSKKV